MIRDCTKIPRFILPVKGEQRWPASFGTSEEDTAADLFLPEGLSEEEEEQAIEVLRERAFRLLTSDRVEKIRRGSILAERRVEGGVRRGLVATLDLEALSIGTGNSLAVLSSLWDETRAKSLLRLRRRMPIECSTVVVLYRDKRSRALSEAGSDLEQMYSFTPSQGKVTGKFIPMPLAKGVSEETLSRGDPCYTVIGGLEEAVAAKAYWEEVKKSISREALRNHPARFVTAEYVNAYDDAVRLSPIHRIAEGIPSDLVASCFNRNLRCKRQGNVFRLSLATPENIARCDGLLARLAEECGGAVLYERDEGAAIARAEGADCAAILLPVPDKGDLFVSPKELPMPYFTLPMGEERYALEVREIGYD